MKYSELKLILASQSPRRRQLIAEFGLPFECITTCADEKTTETDPEKVAMDISRQKAEWACENMQLNDNEVIIGADTIVVFNGKILGKPKSDDDARRMLKMLSGNTHSVYTGVTIIWKRAATERAATERAAAERTATTERTATSFAEKTDVTFAAITDDELEAYIKTGDHKDKAGSYGIQGPFSLHIPAICGDYNNVVGFPIARIYNELKKHCDD